MAQRLLRATNHVEPHTFGLYLLFHRPQAVLPALLTSTHASEEEAKETRNVSNPWLISIVKSCFVLFFIFVIYLIYRAIRHYLTTKITLQSSQETAQTSMLPHPAHPDEETKLMVDNRSS